MNWEEYAKLVAEAYDRAPSREPEAEASFGAMLSACERFFKILQSKVKVEFVDGDPYTSAEQMRDDVTKTKVLKIMKDHSDHPFFTPEQNWKFRTVHDWFTHVISGQPFTRKGELSAYNTHIKMFPPAAWPALFTEIVGQVCYQSTRGSFPEQKVCILRGFDYKNIGKITDESLVQGQQQETPSSTEEGDPTKLGTHLTDL